MIRPYNGSMFQMRDQYPNVFPIIHKKEAAHYKKVEEDKLAGKSELIVENKIKYSLNIIPMVKGDNDLIESIFQSEELEIYECQAIKDIIDYKWRVFSKTVHKAGACIHIAYMLVLILYINAVFLEPEIVYNEDGRTKVNPEPEPFWLYFIAAFLIYPTVYDGMQMCKAGLVYF